MEPRHLAPRPLREPGSPAGGHDDDTDPGIPRHLAGGRRAPAPDDPPAGPGEQPGAPVSSSRWVLTPGLVAGAGAILVLAVVLAVIASQNGVFPEREDALGAGDAVALGLVEGVTEWLPISSTGHLTVTQDLLGIDGDAADSYAIAIQAGAILAVLGLYRARFASMIDGVLGRDPVGRNTAIAIVIACLPAVLVALVAEDAIKENLFGGWPVILAWAVGGVVILLVARQRRALPPDAGNPLSSITWRHALIIGCVQVLALWPGVSRSLTTIVAGTAIGLAVPAAVEFSFLLGFVVLGGATAYEMLGSGGDMIDAYGIATPLLGLVVAFASAVVAMRWMVGYLERHGVAVFGYYRLAAAAILALLMATNVV